MAQKQAARRAGKVTPGKTTNRPPGRPKTGERAGTPETLERIHRLWLRGRTHREIAEVVRMARGTVQHHVQKNLIPLHRERMQREVGKELAKCDLIERVAWERFDVSQEPATREQIKEALLEGTEGAEGCIDLIERITTKTGRDGDTAWLNVVQWCMDFRAKILGSYAANRAAIEDHTVRVAGKTRKDVSREMMARIKLVAERATEQCLAQITRESQA